MTSTEVGAPKRGTVARKQLTRTSVAFLPAAATAFSLAITADAEPLFIVLSRFFHSMTWAPSTLWTSQPVASPTARHR